MAICAWHKCARSFDPVRRNQRFCKSSHATAARVAALRNRRRGVMFMVEPPQIMISEERICEFCGKPFTAIGKSQRGGSEQRFHNYKCRRKAFNKRQALRG